MEHLLLHIYRSYDNAKHISVRYTQANYKYFCVNHQKDCYFQISDDAESLSLSVILLLEFFDAFGIIGSLFRCVFLQNPFSFFFQLKTCSGIPQFAHQPERIQTQKS